MTDRETLKADTESPSSRRRFIWGLWLGLGGVALLEYAWLIADFLRPRKKLADAVEAIVVAGPVERFEPDSVTPFPQGKFYLARLEDGGFLALSRECTHLGCTVPWIADEGRFVCPCHSSAFDIRGDVIDPPAPRALDYYAVRIENKIVKVDVSRPIKRPAFDWDQVTRV
ncbi:MAG: Rieske (2Fe-2S) protein [Gemmatimonadota bacterium]|nr:MAG: Rieske (2Fe-2S) protein [Gemmatimonadota bacterium]